MYFLGNSLILNELILFYNIQDLKMVKDTDFQFENVIYAMMGLTH